VADDVQLLRFLRVRKFSMDTTFKTFEDFYVQLAQIPSFLEFLRNDEVIDAMLETRFCYPLAERDSLGRKIILWQCGKLDPEKFPSNLSLYLSGFLSFLMSEEEETQIAGFVTICDLQGASLKHIFDPKLFFEVNQASKRAPIMRFKRTFLINAPTAFYAALTACKMIVGEKISSRVQMVKDYNELSDFMDIKLLPKELGGVTPEQEMFEEFMRFKKEKIADVLSIISSFDVNKVPAERLIQEQDHKNVGSFRKLEID
jgi:CRAL/TRIO domain